MLSFALSRYSVTVCVKGSNTHKCVRDRLQTKWSVNVKPSGFGYVWTVRISPSDLHVTVVDHVTHSVVLRK